MAKHHFLVLFFGLLWVSSNLRAQNTATPKTVEEEFSDPRAVFVLESTQKKVSKWQNVQVDFTSITMIPDQPQQTQKGKLIQQGSKYRLDIPDRTIVNDGQALWTYLPADKEVTIRDNEAEGEYNTPLDWLKIYEKKDYYFALTNQVKENGVLLDQIEFKPRDRKAEYSKVRLSIDPTNTPKKIEIFFKDGMRMILQLDKLNSNAVIDPATFLFDAKKYPGVHVEDLRF